MLKIAQYPKDFDGRPLDLLAAVATDASGNNGAQFPQSVVGPDGVPVDKVGLVLLDKAGNIFSSAIEAVDRTALAAISANDDEPRYLAEAGREGMFVWQSDNLSGQLITNGAFDTDTSGWAVLNAALSIVAGRMRVTKPGSSAASAWQAITTVVGRSYTITFDLITGSAGLGNSRLNLGTFPGAFDIGSSTIAGVGQSLTFAAVGTTTYISLTVPATATNGTYGEFDNVSISFAGVVNDPYQGVFVPPASDPTGVSGAWVRRFTGPVQLSWFGVVPGCANMSARCTSAVNLLAGTRANSFRLPQGLLALDVECQFDHLIDFQGAGPAGDQGLDGDGGNAATKVTVPAGVSGFHFKGRNSDGGAMRSSIDNIFIEALGKNTNSVLASYAATYNGDGLRTTYNLAAAGDFQNNQWVRLAGAVGPITWPGVTAQITTGTNVVNITSSLVNSNPNLMPGMRIDIAGAGLPTPTYVGVYNTTTQFTLVKNDGTPALATVTQAAALVSLYGDMVARIYSGAGTTTLIIDRPPDGTIAVANAKLYHCDSGIVGECQLKVGDHLISDNFQGCGLLTFGFAANSQTNANQTQVGAVRLGGNTFAGWAIVGYDANECAAYGADFSPSNGIGVYDQSLIGGASLYGIQIAFGLGLFCATPLGQLMVFGGYSENGTCYIADPNSNCAMFGMMNTEPGSGFSGWFSDNGRMKTAKLHVAGSAEIDGPLRTGGAAGSFHSGNANAVPSGSTGNGVLLGNDGGTVAWIRCINNTDTASLNTRIWSLNLEFYRSGTGIIATVLASGLDITSGKVLSIGGATAIDGSRNGSFVGVTASGNVIAVGTVTGSNLAGTNTGDQAAGAGILLSGGTFSAKFRNLFNSFADAQNTTTTETDIFTNNTAAGELSANGDRIEAVYSGVTVASATATRDFKVYFAGTNIFDSTALTINAAASWEISVKIIRVSATVVRYSIILHINGLTTELYTKVGELTGLTLSNANILKLTGQAAGTGAATGDIVGKLSAVDKRAA